MEMKQKEGQKTVYNTFSNQIDGETDVLKAVIAAVRQKLD